MQAFSTSPETAPFDSRLAAGMTALGFSDHPAQRKSLLAFLALLHKWNRAYNLTAIRNPREGVDLHLLDSLTLAPYLHGGRILDVGTGAGLPGLPLAIVNPEREFVLLDSNAKKTRFVRQAVIELGLRNVEVVTTRIEDYQPERGFDSILSRAFASLDKIVATTERLLAPQGKILAQKGLLPRQEIETLTHHTVRVHKLAVPGLDLERHLVDITAD